MKASLTAPPLAVVIGAGPAGLMAAEMLLEKGIEVHLYDAMPSAGRKFLMAGKSGLNITHSEPLELFLTRFGNRRPQLEPCIRAFPPAALRAWIQQLGIETFVGSSGRVFPREMKAAPLLRAWLHRLHAQGATTHMRHRWLGWSPTGGLRFDTPQGEHVVQADAVILALGGASWPQLGSTAEWVPLLAAAGVSIAELEPSNCGFHSSWSDHFLQRFAGAGVKRVAARVPATAASGRWQRGEFVITRYGVEGGLVYALSAALRDRLRSQGEAWLELDLLPDLRQERVLAELQKPRGARSLSETLRRRLRLGGVKLAMLRELLTPVQLNDPQQLAAGIKGLLLPVQSARPIAEAISSAGGVRFEAMDQRLMLRQRPGVFCAGEMLDWDAPTGGYLLTGCIASGRAAGLGAAAWLRERSATASLPAPAAH